MQITKIYFCRATVHLEDGLLTAKIETPQDTYHIEPSWRHLTNQKSDQMIAYKESDVIHPGTISNNISVIPIDLPFL